VPSPNRSCAADSDHNASCRAVIRQDRVTWYDPVSMRGWQKLMSDVHIVHLCRYILDVSHKQGSSFWRLLSERYTGSGEK
jgi:hypothetical protein